MSKKPVESPSKIRAVLVLEYDLDTYLNGFGPITDFSELVEKARETAAITEAKITDLPSELVLESDES